MMKRFFDLLVSTFSLVLLAPVMLIAAVLIKLDSKGPILFKQKRVGLNGREFVIYKFRSMIENAEKQGPFFTAAGDARVTRLGVMIRKLSLDELPQIINVIKGDMSVVGPRPNVPAQLSQYRDGEWDRRNSVRPGITGLAQATLRSAATQEQRTALDLEYVDKSGVLFDIWIIILTVKQLFTKGGY